MILFFKFLVFTLLIIGIIFFAIIFISLIKSLIASAKTTLLFFIIFLKKFHFYLFQLNDF